MILLMDTRLHSLTLQQAIPHDDRYKPGVKFSEIYQLYQFDRKLQISLFDVTTTIEKLINPSYPKFFLAT